MAGDVATMQRLTALVAAPVKDINRRLLAEIVPAAAHRALAVFVRAGTRAPVFDHGRAAITKAVKAAGLARLLPVVSARGAAMAGASLPGSERMSGSERVRPDRCRWSTVAQLRLIEIPHSRGRGT